MKEKSKIYAFIDSQNLNLGVRSQGWILDFGRFRKYLEDKYKVGESFLFIGYVTGNESLYAYLQRAGFVVIFKPTLVYKKDGEIYTKGNVDAELVLHSMIEYSNYDKAIIVSGDGDFHCLLEHLEKKEKLGRIIIPNRKAYSQLLWKFKKRMDYMNNLEDKLKKS